MIKEVIQTCDWCGEVGKSFGMQIPDGWLIIDTRGGRDPGIQGYGWNLCCKECLLEMLDDWAKGLNPMPWGMSEQSQVIHEVHDHEHLVPSESPKSDIPPPRHGYNPERDIEAVAAAGAEVSHRRRPAPAAPPARRRR